MTGTPREVDPRADGDSADSGSADADPFARLPSRVRRVLISEEAIYGLILVSGMIVVSNSIVGTSLNALLTVVATVVVFFAAHVYAGTIARMADGDGVHLRSSFRAAVRHSQGMVFVSIVPIIILALGISRLIDDEVAIWTALAIDTILLGVLGWLAVSKWTKRLWPRLLSALITAGFGGIITVLKALVHH